ncbi:MAG: fatty-acid desaturase [Verrucomicrobiales bacterium]|jgi:fatty-acid desaturase
MTKMMNLPMLQIELPRVRARDVSTSPIEGSVHWDAPKSITFFTLALLAVVFAIPAANAAAVLVCLLLTGVSVCGGHSVGLHRLLIHRSFRCPLVLEHFLVYLGVLVGMGGPFGLIWMHDLRDWAQRHPACHSYLSHRNRIWKDAWWNLHCELVLQHPPEFQAEPETSNDRFYQFLEKTWRWQQLPVALILFVCGGWSWVVWGVCVRLPACLLGHWLVNYLAHNGGARDWHLEGHVVQGYNLPALSLLSMGEAWHNNHHAYPGSARHGHRFWQLDPGWWLIATLRRIGLVWEVTLPEDLPLRPELERVE